MSPLTYCNPTSFHRIPTTSAPANELRVFYKAGANGRFMYLHIAIVGGVNLYRFESASRHGDTRLCGSESDCMKAYASATEAKEQFEARSEERRVGKEC